MPNSGPTVNTSESNESANRSLLLAGVLALAGSFVHGQPPSVPMESTKPAQRLPEGAPASAREHGPAGGAISKYEGIRARVIHLYYFRDEAKIVQIIRKSIASGEQPRVKEIDAGIDAVTKQLNETSAKRADVEARLKSMSRSSLSEYDNSPAAASAVPNGDLASLLGQQSQLRDLEESLRRQQFQIQSERDNALQLPFVLGDLQADDPVSQVTVHALGEGKIHVRGPIKGINRIAQMIHEVDKPVGQIKVGIHTIQVNIDRRDPVEDMHAVIEGHFSHARFLSVQTAFLFRQAVEEVASRLPKKEGTVAEHFFCSHFLEEMRRVECAPILANNEFLSLGSVNSLNLLGALYVTSLAEDAVRARIFDEFLRLVGEKLAAHELAYCRGLQRTPRQRKFAHGVLLCRFNGRPAQLRDEEILQRAHSMFVFPNVRYLLEGQAVGRGSFNAVQAATLQLAMSLRQLRVAELELENLKLERALVARAPSNKVEDLLLDKYLDEREEKIGDLWESVRLYVANVDGQLRQMAMAFEDDIQTQFYKPAFRDIRRASEGWDVSLGQLESTTILTHDRTLARVNPGQNLDLDLPTRRPLLQEGLATAEALAGEAQTGLARYGLRSAATAANPAAGALVDAATGGPPLGAKLEQLLPTPELHTASGGNMIEIRPVIQPDGYSIAYEFVYAYANDVSGPSFGLERQLPRIQRHFIKAEVQTNSYELREISRFRVATSASKRPRGIPLLEEIPYAGALFRSRRSEDGAFQDNIILADCVVYPTVFNLLGKDWFRGPDLDPRGLIERERLELARRSRIHEQLIANTHREAEAIVGLPPLMTPSTERTGDPPTPSSGVGYGGPAIPAIANKSGEETSEPPIRRLGYRPSELPRETPRSQGWRGLQTGAPAESPAPTKGSSNHRPPLDSPR